MLCERQLGTLSMRSDFNGNRINSFAKLWHLKCKHQSAGWINLQVFSNSSIIFPLTMVYDFPSTADFGFILYNFIQISIMQLVTFV